MHKYLIAPNLKRRECNSAKNPFRELAFREISLEKNPLEKRPISEKMSLFREELQIGRRLHGGLRRRGVQDVQLQLEGREISERRLDHVAQELERPQLNLLRNVRSVFLQTSHFLLIHLPVAHPGILFLKVATTLVELLLFIELMSHLSRVKQMSTNTSHN